MTQVVLGLGANIPFARADGALVPPCEVLELACGRLGTLLSEMRRSSVYKTKPRYVEDQNDFFNMVVCGLWARSARELLDETQAVEAAFGRERLGAQPKGPRTLDIDIELFGGEVIREEGAPNPLFVPHPLMHERQFVLVPLLEILPEIADPITGRKYGEMLAALPDQGVKLWKQRSIQNAQS